MLRRSMLELSRRRLFIRNVQRQILATQPQQILLSLCPPREFSTMSPQNMPPRSGSTGKPAQSGSNSSKILIGSVIIGSVAMAAYSTGYLDRIFIKESHGSEEATKVDTDGKIQQSLRDGEYSREQKSPPMNQDSQAVSSSVEQPEESGDVQSHSTPVEDSTRSEAATQFPLKNLPDLTPAENDTLSQETESSKLSHDMVGAGEQVVTSKELFDKSVNKENPAENAHLEQHERAENAPKFTEDSAVTLKHETDTSEHPSLQGQSKDESPSSLLDAYYLRDKAEEETSSSLAQEKIPEASSRAIGDRGDAYVSNDGKLILDFLQAIHTAEQRQAELDAHIFAEEKRTMKEKYERELKDARARELMYAEEVAILDKEIKKERAKAAAALKSLQEKAEERLKMELEQKEKEAESKLKEVQEFGKAELAAALVREKAAQIEKMEEANLNINALCMAFYARSEEARQNHSIHKLALGALVLEDALSNGLPIESELAALRPHFDGVDKDSLLDLVLSSLPEETQRHGTDTLPQLNQKFDQLKGTLRHFSFIPPGGGGILANALAHTASFLKVKEADQSGDGIESVINQVESLLAEGKLAEAADALELGVKGCAAAEVVVDWVRRVRNRAITEQALMLLHSYATSLSVSLA
ncbi:hypothetical protein Ancab_026363 [Ancistrocladus abbreviatus]